MTPAITPITFSTPALDQADRGEAWGLSFSRNAA